MTDIDRIIANCRRDSRTVSGSERRALCDEIERLRAIVDRLPKTKDGVTVTPGMRLYVIPLYGREYVEDWADTMRLTQRDYFTADQCYSTLEAAEAAKEKT